MREPSQRPSPLTWLVVFPLVAGAVVWSGYVYQRRYRDDLRAQVAQGISAVAELRVAEVAQWRHEMMSYAVILSSAPAVTRGMERLLSGNQADPVVQELRRWLESVSGYYQCDDILLLDLQGKVRLSLLGSDDLTLDRGARLAAQAASAGGVIFADPERSADGGVNILVVAPLFVAGATQHPVGALVLRIDPMLSLFPLVQSWPTSSPTAETYIVRQEGGEVLYLNEVRHRIDTALLLRRPVADEPLGSRRGTAVWGRRDYRGEPVVAVAREVPDSSWVLVAKQDEGEALAPLRTHARTAALLVALIILGAGFATALLWRHESAVYYRRQYEAARERQALERHNEYLTRYANDIILLTNGELRIQEANERAGLSYGYSREELRGMSLAELHVPGTAPAPVEQMERARAQGGCVFEAQQRRRDGSTFPVEVSARVFDIEGAAGYCQWIARDITERRRAEEARAKLEAQLGQAQKMEGVGLLAGGIAHDFNNLLTPILSNAELLIRDLALDDPRHALARDIKQAADRAHELTRQLLAFGRKQMLELKPTNLGAVVTRFERMLRRTIREDIRIEVAIAPGAGTVRADVGQIEQVLLNLAINARDAMPKEGRLTIQVQNEDLDDGYTSQHAEAKPGPYVMLAVSDTGGGMDPETQRRLFEPFFTTKESGKGTGLGLATVYGIVKQHGGSISVYSEQGKGSTFKVYLPRVLETGEIATRSRPASEATVRGNETVLVVEDNDLVRGTACELLRRLGYRVLAAESAESCSRLAEDHEGVIDLLLTDVILPKSNGREVFQRLNAKRPNLKVLYMSGYTDDVIAHHGLVDEGIHFIHKPLSLQALSVKTRQALEGSPHP